MDMRLTDHGYVFNGPNWTLENRYLGGIVAGWERDIYGGIHSVSDLHDILTKIERLPQFSD